LVRIEFEPDIIGLDRQEMNGENIYFFEGVRVDEETHKRLVAENIEVFITKSGNGRIVRMLTDEAAEKMREWKEAGNL
jgi:hypothetical protein